MIPDPTKVLVIDDDPVVLAATADHLQSRGFAVITFESGIGASNLLRAERPDVVLVDVNMPALQGDTVVRFLSKVLPDADSPAVLLYSTLSQERLDTLARNCGAAGGVVKGDFPALVRAIDGFVPRDRRSTR